jgi:acyl dehydratase
MLLYSTLCGVLGTHMPGPGTVQLVQELMFPNPTFVGDIVTLRLEVTEIQEDQGLADLTTTVTKADGNVGLQGRTLVRLPEHAFRPSEPTASLEHTDQPSLSFKDMEIGQRAEVRRTFTIEDLVEYADLAGDANPLFADLDYAKRMDLAAPMIPGCLLGGLFSYLLGTRLPGRGTNYLKQRLEFLAPAHTGQELTAAVQIVRFRPEKQLVNLSTLCTNPMGEVVCTGEALVLVSDVKRDV